jgi:hypothetical protein
LQEQALSVSTITVGVTHFFPNERSRENHLKEHTCFVKSEEKQSAIFVRRFLRSYRLLVRVLVDEALAIFHESQKERAAAAPIVNAVSVSDSTVKPGLG